jgi:hypothetical protein
MHAGIEDVFLHRHGGCGKGGVGRGLVTRIPGEDVVVVLTRAVGAAGLASQVFAQNRGIGLERLVRVDDDGQLLVLDLNRFDAVGGGITIFGDDNSHLLHLEMHLFVGQNGCDIASQRRHPMQLQWLEVIGRQHGDDAGHLQRLGLVDLLDATMGNGAADDVHVQHAGHLDVVDVIAFALDETGIFLAQAAVAHALEGCGAGQHLGIGRCVHESGLLDGGSARSGGDGGGFPQLAGGVLNRLHDVLVAGAAAQVAAHACPDLLFRRIGVLLQEPIGAHQHAWRAEAALQAVLLVKAFLNGVQHGALRQALDGGDGAAIALNRQVRAALDGLPVDVDGTGAAMTGFAAYVGTGQIELLSQEMDQQGAGLNGLLLPAAVDGNVDQFLGHGWSPKGV